MVVAKLDVWFGAFEAAFDVVASVVDVFVGVLLLLLSLKQRDVYVWKKSLGLLRQLWFEELLLV